MIFQPLLVALKAKDWEPALKFTVCKTVVQLCQAPVDRIPSVPYTRVPPALLSCKVPLPLSLAMRYNTVYILVVGIVMAR